MRMHRRPGFREGWKMMDLPRRSETLWSQFHGGCGEREVMVFARAKVAFFPESEKMTRKADRSCVKIKCPVFLPVGSLAYYNSRKLQSRLLFQKENEKKRDRTLPSPMTFDCLSLISFKRHFKSYFSLFFRKVRRLKSQTLKYCNWSSVKFRRLDHDRVAEYGESSLFGGVRVDSTNPGPLLLSTFNLPISIGRAKARKRG